ncbi:MAG: protein kinase [Nannocystaceae bacterium]
MRLGRYQLVGRLAEGGTSTVYLGRSVGEGGFVREFAIKVLHPHLDSSLRARFLDEARLTSRVRHPNIVDVVDLGVDRGLDYLVLELVDGVDLRRLMLSRSVPLRPSQAAFLIATIARGVHALHTAVDEHGQPMQAVHRDLSPHNLMIDRSGRPVLIDFGLVKLREQAEKTQVGVLCGRLPYMSPEQAQLQPVDGRSDVFSLGSVLFELLTGRLPFGDDDTRATLERLVACDTAAVVSALAARFPGKAPADVLGQGLAEIVLACLQKDPADRFASAAALADAIEQQLAISGVDLSALQRELADIATAASSGPVALSPATLPRGRAGNGRRAPWLLALAAGVTLTLAGVATWLALQPDEPLHVSERTAPALASDASLSPRPAGTTRAPSSEPAATAITVPMPMPTATPPIVTPLLLAPEPAAGPARSGRARKRARALKPNPYSD